MNEVIHGKIWEGYLAEIVNTKPIGRANKTYIVATMEWHDPGTEDFIFFTEHEIEVARKRGERYKELQPKRETTLGIFKTGFSQIGHVVYVPVEKKKNWRQPDGYYFVRLIGFDGRSTVYAFTPAAMNTAQRRTARNPEDKPKKTAFVNFAEDLINKFR